MLIYIIGWYGMDGLTSIHDKNYFNEYVQEMKYKPMNYH